MFSAGDVTVWVPIRAADSSADATFVARLLTNSDDLEHKNPENDVCVSSHTRDAISWSQTALFTFAALEIFQHHFA